MGAAICREQANIVGLFKFKLKLMSLHRFLMATLSSLGSTQASNTSQIRFSQLLPFAISALLQGLDVSLKMRDTWKFRRPPSDNKKAFDP
jgi:hypothetical protein